MPKKAPPTKCSPPVLPPRADGAKIFCQARWTIYGQAFVPLNENQQVELSPMEIADHWRGLVKPAYVEHGYPLARSKVLIWNARTPERELVSVRIYTLEEELRFYAVSLEGWEKCHSSAEARASTRNDHNFPLGLYRDPMMKEVWRRSTTPSTMVGPAHNLWELLFKNGCSSVMMQVDDPECLENGIHRQVWINVWSNNFPPNTFPDG